jgi:hypothetical protein
MNLLQELNNILAPIIPVETGVFSEPAPERYIVITPMADTFDLFTDDKPRHETQEARLSLFDKGNCMSLKNQIIRSLLETDFTITDCRYLGHEDDTGYHHYAIDVAKNYELEE